MLCCFGSAWMASIYKSYVSKTSKGKSIYFMFIVLFGYTMGIFHKIFYNYDWVIVLYVLLFILIFVDIGFFFRNYKLDKTNRSFRVDLMKYYDEVLKQSVRNYAFTGNVQWVEKYEETRPLADNLLSNALKNADKKHTSFFSEIYLVNQKLVKIECIAINYVNDGKNKDAIELLDGKEYLKQTKVFGKSLEKFLKEHHLTFLE